MYQAHIDRLKAKRAWDIAGAIVSGAVFIASIPLIFYATPILMIVCAILCLASIWGACAKTQQIHALMRYQFNLDRETKKRESYYRAYTNRSRK